MFKKVTQRAMSNLSEILMLKTSFWKHKVIKAVCETFPADKVAGWTDEWKDRQMEGWTDGT